ncbi:epoxyqueuosine reductase QueH [Acidobacteriota bacterium]
MAEIAGFPLIAGPYNAEIWAQITYKYKDEPEKGRRCDICYAVRLKKTAEQAAILGFDGFTTVMSLSPLKKADTLNRIGRMFGKRFGIDFLEANFKKKDGFLKSVRRSKDHGIYRQDYCGCEFSLRDKLKRNK